MTWSEIWEAIKNFFVYGGGALLKALLVFVIGYVVIRIVFVVVRKILRRTKMQLVTQNFLLSIIKFGLYVVLIIMILGCFGVNITGIVAVLASAGLAICLALQNSLSNVASGIILMVTQPFKEGDLVSINGEMGRVKSVKILTTSLITFDNKLIVLPNSSVANNTIINYSNRKQRRVEFTFSVSYEADVELAKKVVTDVMKSNGKVLLKPEPFSTVRSFDLDNNTVNLFSHCWCDTEDYWDVLYFVYDNVFNEFKKNGIKLPYKQVEVRMREDENKFPFAEKNLERIEKVRKNEEPTKAEQFFDIMDDDISEQPEQYLKFQDKWKNKLEEKKAQKKKQKKEKHKKTSTKSEN